MDFEGLLMTDVMHCFGRIRCKTYRETERIAKKFTDKFQAKRTPDMTVCNKSKMAEIGSLCIIR